MEIQCFSSDFQRLNVQLKLSVSSIVIAWIILWFSSLAPLLVDNFNDPVVMATSFIELGWTGPTDSNLIRRNHKHHSIKYMEYSNESHNGQMPTGYFFRPQSSTGELLLDCTTRKWYSLNRFRLWAPGGANWYAWLLQVVQVKSNSVTRLQLGAVSELNLEEKFFFKK